MARQANGQYLQPANTTAVTATTISSTAFNTLITDIGTEITNSVDRGGRSAMTAALPMGGFKITGMADPAVATDGATKNYVDTQANFSTGDIKLTIKTAADSGWLIFDDGTFGNAGSGSSQRNNVDCLALFTVVFNNISDTYAPILTNGGAGTTRAAQTNAATAWAAGCRMSLPKTLGRALAIAGTGSGLTARTLGQTLGEETHVTTASESAVLAYTTSFSVAPTQYGPTTILTNVASTSGISVWASPSSTTTTQAIATNGTLTTTSNAGGNAHNNMQPTTFLNAMMKL